MERGEIVYAVFAAVRSGISHDWLAAYSTPERAQQFIDAQDVQLRECLSVSSIEIDRHPSDEYWAKPGMGANT